MSRQAPRLTDNDIETAVKLLDAWAGKLTWQRYLVVLATQLGHLYTKPGLRKYQRVVDAWEKAKRRVKTKPDGVIGASHGDSALAYVNNRVEILKAENERLKVENTELLAQFQRWTYNAASQGLGKNILDRRIPRRKG
jgi:hypothetical protein|tara:strand:+ start:61 stop:474 length:414 start_codon:yes stop_codon:yes gene_type:complete